jgi:hypothetical protein
MYFQRLQISRSLLSRVRYLRERERTSARGSLSPSFPKRGYCTSIDRTDATLARLIILSVNSGLWTSVFALGAAIMVSDIFQEEYNILNRKQALVNDQSNFEYASLQFCMSPLYCNTILSCLNARDFARNGIRKDESNSDSNFYLNSSHGGGAQRPVCPNQDRNEVFISYY